MRLVAISDLHGTLPDIPACDLLLIAGDICPVDNHKISYQASWLDTTFRFWLRQVPARKIIGVAGNHDFIFQRSPELVPGDLPWSYLQDNGLEWEGVRIYGSPWQLWFYDWAFNLTEEELQAKWALIPEGTDVLVLHGPPYGYGDGVPEGGGMRRCGSHTLLQRIEQLKPKLAVFGHIHEDRGEWRLGPTVLANVSILDGRYNHVHPPWQFNLDNKPIFG